MGTVERFMTLSGAPPRTPLLVPMTRGYGARLEHLNPHAARYDAAVIADGVRREADVLVPDLIVMGYDPTILAESCGCEVRMIELYNWSIAQPAVKGEPETWASWQPPDVGTNVPFVTIMEAMERVMPVISSPIACMLPAPFTLARLLGGAMFEEAFKTGDERWQDLLDISVMVVSDAIKVALRKGSCGIVLYEDLWPLSGVIGDELLRTYGTCFNVLRHHERRCLYVVTGAKKEEVTTLAADSFRDVLAGIVVCISGSNFSDWEEKVQGLMVGWATEPEFFTSGDAAFAAAVTALGESVHKTGMRVFMPIVPATAIPERVRELVTRFRAAAGSVHK